MSLFNQCKPRTLSRLFYFHPSRAAFRRPSAAAAATARCGTLCAAPPRRPPPALGDFPSLSQGWRWQLPGLPWQCRLAGAGRVSADRRGPPGPSGDAGSRREAQHDRRRVPAAGCRDASPALGLEAVGRERLAEPGQPAGGAEPDGPVGAGVRGAGGAAGGGGAAVRGAAGRLVAEPGPPRQPAHRRRGRGKLAQGESKVTSLFLADFWLYM